VLQLVGEGKSTKDVATLLGISVKTAESHRSRLMQKLDTMKLLVWSGTPSGTVWSSRDSAEGFSLAVF
jgi:transposase